MTPDDPRDRISAPNGVRDEAAREFVATASHELRTPLTSIHGALQLALAGSGHKLDQEDRELLQIALASTDRLARLVTDLLDLSKIDAGRMPFELMPLDLRSLLEESARAMQGLAAQRRASIAVRHVPDVAVPGDRDHLMRVMTNLVSNALKYAPERTEVRLDAVATSEGIEIRVEDQGPGIPANQLDRLFQPFSRVGIHERQTTGGTGLGLAISRAIVEQHGGKIWAERLEPHGTRFAFVLPCPKPVLPCPPSWLPASAGRPPTARPPKGGSHESKPTGGSHTRRRPLEPVAQSLPVR